jgi:MFS-type transporter involved in bile tolerance (Atg22 family)
MGVLAFSMALTMLVREEPLTETPPPLNWTPFLRLLMMTALFTAIILGLGEAVRLVGRLIGGLGSVTEMMAVMGTAGLVAMSIAVVLGVWTSIRISTGEAARGNPSFTWWVINRLAYLVGAMNLSTFAVYFLQARLELAREEAAGPVARLIMVVGICILVFALIGGWLTDKFDRKRLVALSGIIAALGTFILVLTPDLTIIYIGGGLVGAATGLFYTANWALGTELVPKGEAGRYLGISNLAGAGAGAVGAYIGGPIADYFTELVPDVRGMGYVLLFAIYGGLFLLSVLALARVHEPTKQEVEA